MLSHIAFEPRAWKLGNQNSLSGSFIPATFPSTTIFFYLRNFLREADLSSPSAIFPCIAKKAFAIVQMGKGSKGEAVCRGLKTLRRQIKEQTRFCFPPRALLLCAPNLLGGGESFHLVCVCVNLKHIHSSRLKDYSHSCRCSTLEPTCVFITQPKDTRSYLI